MAKSALFFLFLLSLLSPLATADVVVETCKTIAAGDPLLNYKYCVSLFNSVPTSHNTDVKGLALISTQLATQKIKHLLADINSLLKSAQPGRNPKTGCLKTCEELYTDAADNLQESAQTIKSSRFVDAQITLGAALDAGSDCEDSFSEASLGSPLTSDNNDYTNVARVALAIVAQLSGKH
ncbi:Putative invertase inhibitor [Apostasia shenzhenica]|uniref:Invertase inhibitor n=1 Tax=Apostasia shenzhenica TaxID=1088818 RepID=A0A2H9ZUG2_9ASPA|nr:Putative invertase inhibitor [Apostasia shenzhenica]